LDKERKRGREEERKRGREEERKRERERERERGENSRESKIPIYVQFVGWYHCCNI